MERPKGIFVKRDQTIEDIKRQCRRVTIAKNRQAKPQLTYLKSYPQDLRIAILRSMEQDVPQILPKLEISTISYYRRDYVPIFKIHPDGVQTPDPHMTLQSLWILAGTVQDKFQDFQRISKQFQNNLSNFLDLEIPEIRKFAIIAAGNKILGLEADILRIVQEDPSEVWILVNHIYAGNISSKYLYKYLNTSTAKNDQIILRALFQLTSNSVGSQIIHYLKDYPEAILKLISFIKQSENLKIKAMSIRIVGNILTQLQFALTFQKQNILSVFYQLLNDNNQEIVKDVCWALTNFVSENIFAQCIFQHENILARLIGIFLSESSIMILNELVIVFKHLVICSSEEQTLRLFLNENLIPRFCQLFDTLENNLIYQILIVIDEILLKVLPEQQNSQSQQMSIESAKNRLIFAIAYNYELRNKIQQFTQSHDQNIRQVAEKILQKLQNDYQ